ncbi:uncharacterized protein LOC135461884 [Liolophura sinensis]|uniref:uncharacterized protein LOC135461884 n=1 Tax=Liolophura sinensis TaxID=3198878 RepID=UPI003159372D
MMCSTDVYERFNPDRDFVLHGNSPPSFCDRPGNLTNSQNTTTTLNLNQTSGYRPKNYTEELVRSHDSGLSSLKKGDTIMSFGGRPKSTSDSSWYTNPVHLSEEYDQYPLFRSMGVPMRHVAPVSRPVGFTGISLASEKPKQYALRSTEEMQDYVRSHLGKDEVHHFPVTMSASKLVGPEPPLVKPTAILHQHGIAQKLAPRRSRSPTRSRSPMRSKSATRSLRKDQSFDATKNLEKLYLMTSEAPAIGSADVYVTSPYQQELSRLRMEQLRLEEEQLLEMKRQSELERIRGPRPKWYEMKTPEFHYEAHKNTEMLKSKNSWNDLLRYRSDLTQASKDFQMSLGEVI